MGFIGLIFYSAPKAQADHFVVFISSCTGGVVNGKQTGCSDAGDNEIINKQCKTDQYKSAPEKCASMPAYLSAMTADCNVLKSSGVVCDAIDNGGFYGREASAFADFYINFHLEGRGDTTDSACKGKKEDEQCDMGGGLGFGKCKIDGGELACVIDNAGGGGDTGGGVYIPGEEIGLSEKSIQEILINLLTWALEIVGVLALLGFVVSGIQYIVSSGDEDIMKSAKRNMVYSIMGVIVVLASVVIIKAIEAALQAKSLI